MDTETVPSITLVPRCWLWQYRQIGLSEAKLAILLHRAWHLNLEAESVEPSGVVVESKQGLGGSHREHNREKDHMAFGLKQTFGKICRAARGCWDRLAKTAPPSASYFIRKMGLSFLA